MNSVRYENFYSEHKRTAKTYPLCIASSVIMYRDCLQTNSPKSYRNTALEYSNIFNNQYLLQSRKESQVIKRNRVKYHWLSVNHTFLKLGARTNDISLINKRDHTHVKQKCWIHLNFLITLKFYFLIQVDNVDIAYICYKIHEWRNDFVEVKEDK